MIIDKLENLEKYATLNPLFPKVVEFLKANDLSKETHNKMIDIQIPLTAAETYGYTQRDLLPELPYNEEKDITKIPDLAADSYVTCQPGMMVIFFPQDGHAPCIAGVPEFKKAIFKIKY